MANRVSSWTKGNTRLSWKPEEREKARHMLKRHSPEYVSKYLGMPMEIVETVQKSMNPDGTRRGDDVDRVRIEKLSQGPAIAPNPKEEIAHRANDNAFVKRLRIYGQVAA